MDCLRHCFLLLSTTNKNKIEHSDTAIYLESDEPSNVIFHNRDILNNLPFHHLISVLLEVFLPRFYILWNRLSQRLQLIVTDDVKMRVGNKRLLTDNIPCNLRILHHLRPCFWTQEYPQMVPGRSKETSHRSGVDFCGGCRSTRDCLRSSGSHRCMCTQRSAQFARNPTLTGVLGPWQQVF
ncbi:hypothetical protein BJX66DRAFT_305244 [Aspergillus keveii]|uniref:Uncharacterized protein n=1 Tax=Aspergillus keveii TaxID=714993 RepID=A0ABR4G491_9EURO